MKHANLSGSARGRAVLKKTALSMLSVTPVLMAILGASLQAFAAEAAPQSAADVDEEIVVTGTRIVRDGYEAPTPVTVIGVAELESNATSNITYALTSMPAIMGSSTTNSGVTTGAAGTAGTNRLSLRGLGSGRTLVLVDGHRMPPAHPSGGVDLNTLPQHLISRVDVVTGGASAVYGSDAVAGVVNFILNKEFTGVKGELSGGATTYGDSWNYKTTITGGTPFASGRGHALLAVEHVFDEGVGTHARDWLFTGNQRMNNSAYSATCGCPQFLVSNSVGYTQMSAGGMIFAGPLKGTVFGEGGAATRFAYGSYTAEPYTVGGDWASNNLRPTNPLSPRESRQSAFGRVSYDLSDDVNVYFQYAWTTEKTRAVISSFFMQGNGGPLITRDNAFIPETLRAQMVALNVTNFRLGTYNLDLGPANQHTERTAYTYMLGATGSFDAGDSTWNWDVFAQYGLAKTVVTIVNHISRARYFEAVDAVIHPQTGRIVCRSTLTNPNNTCSPWNPLGINVNSKDSGGYYYVTSPSYQNGRMRQDFVGANITGEPFDLWAGPVSVAFDFQYRKDSAVAVVDAGSLAADHLFGNTSPLDGRNSVLEGAVEAVIPLAKDETWASAWDFSAAARATDYKLAGYVTTWKVGTTYSPVPDLRFRATRSRDIRAPNLEEQFLPQNTAFSDQFDLFRGLSVFVPTTTLGNVDLLPEKADTTQIGAVFQPSFLPGFSASIDYWDINLKGIISTLSQANIIGLCFDGSRPDLCANLERDAAGNLTRIVRKQINFAFERTKGIDIEASYNFPLESLSDSLTGALNIRTFLGIYLKDIQESAIAAPVDLVGSGGVNKWRLNSTISYNLDALTASVTMRAFSSGIKSATWLECTTQCPVSTTAQQTVNDNYLPGATYFDLNLNYEFTDNGSVFFNVKNIENRDPGFTETGNAFMNGTLAGTYDTLGRTFRLGIRYQM
jgi:iron complex outermembrane receptor protein